MAKTITISEDGTSRTFTCKKLETNLSSSGTCYWVPEDEVDEYVELEELRVTDNGTYTPTEKVGFSKVVVDVEGGGGGGGEPEGTEVQATALENISAWERVYVIGYNEPGITSLTMPSSKASHSPLGCDGEYLYFCKTGSSDVYRVPLEDTSEEPTLYKDMTGLDGVSMVHEFLTYSDNGIGQVEILGTNISTTGGIWCIGEEEIIVGGHYNAGRDDYRAWILKRNNLQEVCVTGNEIAYNLRPSGDNNAVRPWNSTSYAEWVNDSQVSGFTQYGATLNNQDVIWCFSGNIVSYSNMSLGYSSGSWNDLEEETSSIISNDKSKLYGHDRFSHTLLVPLGSNGTAIINTDMEVTIIPTSDLPASDYYFRCGDYILNANLGAAYKMISDPVMGKTDKKKHAGDLGYVKEDVAQGEIGTAIVMFS